jgi:NAD(P)-dependent dehydrogenase (short-subunit alcohol dehydrogenase family)
MRAWNAPPRGTASMAEAPRILVTGARHGGIGGAAARRLACDGARMVIAATGERPDFDLLADELEALGAKVLALPGDLEDPQWPGEITDAAAEFCGGLNTVVSCAGRSGHGSLSGITAAQWDACFALNARAPWLLAKAAYPYLAASRGSFTAIASAAGSVTYPGGAAYPAAKAALIALCRQLALEWAPDAVRVNTISPGLVSTPRSPKITAGRIIPLGRAGVPEDIAAAVAFLASPAAAYITGQDIVIDGGLSAAGLAASLGSSRD